MFHIGYLALVEASVPGLEELDLEEPVEAALPVHHLEPG